MNRNLIAISSIKKPLRTSWGKHGPCARIQRPHFASIAFIMSTIYAASVHADVPCTIVIDIPTSAVSTSSAVTAAAVSLPSWGQGEGATDAANAAIDAENAAIDAENAATDAATAAAQDAADADAVAALSTQVNAMVSSLKAQLTALTNLVIKIQKKVKA